MEEVWDFEGAGPQLLNTGFRRISCFNGMLRVALLFVSGSFFVLPVRARGAWESIV